jgi:hypothetical protein
MSGSPDGGTPIEALETGNVTNAADASRMAQILQDMNASGAEVAANPVISSAPPPPPQQMMPQQMPQFQMPPQAANSMTGQIPMMVQQQQQQQIPSNFVPYEDESAVGAYNGAPKKNMWSNILDRLVDPLLVAVLIFTLSLPVLQTFLSKHATWAFSLGGQLSWLGLIAKSIFGGLLFALIKMGASMAGL